MFNNILHIKPSAKNISINFSAIIFSKKTVLNAIVLLSFFPFLALIPGITAEVQPYCYIVCVMFVFLFKEKLPINYYYYFAIVIAYFLFYFILKAYNHFDFAAIPHLIIFIGPPLFFIILFKFRNSISLKSIHIIFYLYVATGFIQQFFPLFFTITGLKPILEFLIPRFQVAKMEEFGNRGVTSLTNEPSYAAMIFFASFLAVIFRFIKKEITQKTFFYNLVLFSASILFNASLTSFILTFFILIAYIVYRRKYLASMIFLVVLILPFILFDTGLRVIDLLATFPDLMNAFNWSLYDVLVGPLGSIREFSSWVGIKSAFFHPFGNGYYSALTQFIEVAKSIHIDISKVTFFMAEKGGYINMKPAGFSSLILFELGVIPFLLINTVVWTCFYKVYQKRGAFARFGVPVFCLSWALLNFDSLSSLPSLWFALVISLQIIQYKNNNISLAQNSNS